MSRKIKYSIFTLIITLTLLTTSVFAEKPKETSNKELDAIAGAKIETKKESKSDGGDSSQPEESKLETQKYPIYVNYNNSTSVDLLNEKQLDSLYKYFADNVKTTYPTMDDKDVLIFDQNNIYKMTSDLKNQLKKMDDGKNILPNAITLLNTKPIEDEYTTTLYCMIAILGFAFFRLVFEVWSVPKKPEKLPTHKVD